MIDQTISHYRFSAIEELSNHWRTSPPAVVYFVPQERVDVGEPRSIWGTTSMG